LIIVLAGCYWLLLWIAAPPNSRSEIKLNYPQIPPIDTIREAFLNSASGVTPDAMGLVAGLTIGERDLVSDQLAEQMRITSLTHLVAVSGANLAIVLGAIYLVAARIGLPRNVRFLGALVAMILYVLLVGPESSVIRAATMASFVMAGLWLGRGTKPIYPLALAVGFLLAIDPGLATDVGFALSAFATAGLTMLAQPLYEIWSRRLWKPVALGLAATASAQLFTLPVLLYLQPSLPTYSLIANLVVEPVVAPVTIFGILSVMFAPVFPILTQTITWLASFGTLWITKVAQTFAEMPLARMHFVQGWMGIAISALLVAGITAWIIGPSPARRIAKLVTLAILLFSATWSGADLIRSSIVTKNLEVLACDVGQGDALLVRSAGQVALIDLGRDPLPLKKCLRGLGVDHIDILMLTHFDADHVGGVAALSEVTVDKVLISPFQDDRPLVELTLNFLSRRANISQASSLTSGTLGKVTWRILSPTPTATEASDSNDASLVALFEFEGFNLLTLGDLGEPGQERLIAKFPSLMSSLSQKKLVLKVAHHGSADQSRRFHRLIEPDLAIFSVGRNDYGHPTKSTLNLLASVGALSLRTDLSGSVGIYERDGEIRYFLAGKLSA
jgi:competence protein ComEC